ncbi:CHAT domain-containing protein, partial [bacterium]|nr:CHAT domain-containing protein [bacterium]
GIRKQSPLEYAKAFALGVARAWEEPMFMFRCPRCGGRTELISEMWRSSDGDLTRVRRCVACGHESALQGHWHGGRPPSEKRSGLSASGGVMWSGAVLVIVWISLRVIDYGDRSDLYDGVTSLLEAFRSPVCLAVILVAVIAAALRRGRGGTAQRDALLVQDVQLRTNGELGLTVAVAEGLGAVGRDYELTRDRAREAAVSADLETLARRAARGVDGEPSDAAGIEDVHRTLYSLGRELGAMLDDGPTGAGRAILESPASHMLLRVPSELAGLPWELAVLREGSRPLWEMFALSRQAVVRRAALRARRGTRLPLRVLLLADLEADTVDRGLPAAEREAAELMELGGRRPDVLRVVRRTPRTAADLDALLAEGFDVVHFAGHGGRSAEGAPGWILADGAVVAAEDLRVPPEPPVLIFSNACVPPGSVAGTALAGDLAETFLAWGASSYLGPFWELHDGGSALFARGFYEALAEGATLGLAVQTARRASYSAHAATWASYVLYGDPTLTPAATGD